MAGINEVNDSAYTLHVWQEPKSRDSKGRFNKGRVAWNRGKKWKEMYDDETIEHLKQHLRDVGVNSNRGKGFEHQWRPVIQMDEYGYRLHWYESSAHAARKLGINSRNIRAVCYGKRHSCGGFRWKFDERF